MVSTLMLVLVLLAPVEVAVVHAASREALPGARVITARGDTLVTDARGVVRLDMDGELAAVVSKDGFAEARLVLRASDGRVQVSLFPDRFDLGGLVVEAVRGGEGAPVSATTLGRRALEATYAGGEMPEVLAATPAVTTFSDAGVPLGYTYLRLRGLDQTRVAISVDGIPLNEPEDQGVYFSNFPDFANSVSSVQVQRGVGTSAFGSASYVGAIHVETISPAAEAPGVETQLTLGSFGTRRGSVEGATGLLGSRVAAYGRVSGHATDGYRDHSGSASWSWLARAGRYGERDQLQLLALGGRSWNDMAYLATAASDLEARPTLNYLGEDETDDFRQSLVSVAWSRAVSERLTWTTRLYRTDLSGHYDVAIDGLWRFGVASDWNGLLSYGRLEGGAWSLDAGLHLSDYRRDHTLHVLPDVSRPLYRNAGRRDEQSAFVRARRDAGPWTWTADAQLRRSGFRYEPDADAGAALDPVAWTFFNPRLGVTYRAGGGLEVYAFYGRTSREPTRNDLFGGFDDVGPEEAAFIGDLESVRPESVRDVEVGARWRAPAWAVTANAYWMEFRDEIAPIGRLSYIGLPLRKNVDRSARRGVEVAWTAGREGAAARTGGTLALMRARIDRWVDDTTGRVYLDVPPLLTPGVVAGGWVEVPAGRRVRLRLDGRGVSRQYLANDGDAAFTAPAWVVTHAQASWGAGAHEILLQVRNLLDATAYPAGYHDGVEAHYYPMAGRALLLTWRARLR